MLGKSLPYGYPAPVIPPPAESDIFSEPTSAAAIAAGVRSGALDPVAVTEACLRRIVERDGDIGAFVSLRPDEARAEAAALRDRSDTAALPLAGVPVAIKDNLDVVGLPTRVGSAAVRAEPAEAEAEVVRRLREAGAIIVGKTTLPELGIWATTDGAGGVTRNPRNPRRTAGGSSGGSAAAVAAGLVPLSLGSDGLGSIRIPAAACGVAGFTPGEGFVAPGLRGGDWHGMASTGPLAATVADAALGAAVLGARPALARADVARPLLIAVSTRTPLPGGTVDPEWATAAEETGRALRRAGHHVVEDDPPYSPLYALPIFARWFGGVASAADDLGDDLEWRRLQRRTRTHARLGRLVHAVGGPRDGLRARWREGVDEYFDGYDALITPALAHPPIRARRWSRRGWLRNVVSNARYAPFTALWNLAGTPAGVVPVGTRRGGTPLAVQVVAGRGHEERVLAVMRAVERAVPRA